MMVETLIKDYFQRQNVQTHSETAFNTVESKQPRFSRWILAKFLNFFSTSHNRTHNHNICVSHGEADVWNRKKRPIAPFVFNFQSSTKQWWLEKNPFNVMRVHLMRQMRCNCNGVPINCGFQKKTAEPPLKAAEDICLNIKTLKMSPHLNFPTHMSCSTGVVTAEWTNQLKMQISPIDSFEKANSAEARVWFLPGKD